MLRNSTRVRASAMFRRALKPATDIAQFIAKNRDLWKAARRVPKSCKVLIPTNVAAWQQISFMETVLGMALTLRGAEVHYLICDGVLPACLKGADIPGKPHRLEDVEGRTGGRVCRRCFHVGLVHQGVLGLPIHYFSSLISDFDREEVRAQCRSLSMEELSQIRDSQGNEVGMHVLAGTLRYYAKAELPPKSESEPVLRAYAESALLTSRAVTRLVERERYDVAVFHHGIYVPQGPTGQVMRSQGVRVANWNPSYRAGTFIFSHGDSYHFKMMEEPVDDWQGIAWSHERRDEILAYLKSRRHGGRDWISFHENPTEESSEFVAGSGIDTSKPIIGMLSNVAWDAQLHFSENAFRNMFEWVRETFAYFSKRPDMQLLLRIHPAELRGTIPSRQRLMDEINALYPTLPGNIFVIPPEVDFSTYAAMDLCDSVIIFGTKTGVELTAVGKPVIVAGEAWIRNKGLTYDVSSLEAYLQILDTLPLGRAMPDEQIEQARKYAYHFFFRRMIPLPFIKSDADKSFRLGIETLNELEPGHWPGLDVVCDGILSGSPFIYPAERIGLTDS